MKQTTQIAFTQKDGNSIDQFPVIEFTHTDAISSPPTVLAAFARAITK